jgi:hypothetical protein
MEIGDSRLYIEATVYSPAMDAEKSVSSIGINPPKSSNLTTSSDSCSIRTKTIVSNVYNPMWNEAARISFDTYSGLLDLSFIKIEVKCAVTMGDDVSVAQYCSSLSTLEQGKISFDMAASIPADRYLRELRLPLSPVV